MNEKYGQISLYEINNALNSDRVTNIEKLVPKKYYNHLPLFQEAHAHRIASHRSYEHMIELEEGFESLFTSLYSFRRPQLEEVKKWVQENLAKSYIRASPSPCVTPILFVKKNDQSLQLFVGYWRFNGGIPKNCYSSLYLRTGCCCCVRQDSTQSWTYAMGTIYDVLHLATCGKRHSR